ncbi:MAG: asparaginase domain-containing protein [Sphingobium sp.]
MRRVCLITTGETIASRKEPDSGHVTASLDGAALRAMLGEGLEDIDIIVDEFCKVGSYAMDLALSFSLARHISGRLWEDFDGVVVTHGTDTIGERFPGRSRRRLRKAGRLYRRAACGGRPQSRRAAEHPRFDPPRRV